jgi:CDP-4-dehydro-6-deoxyglucose reductase, E1
MENILKKQITLAEDTIDSEELNALTEWIKAGHRLTKGPLTAKFEKKLASYVNAEYSIFVNSGSSANMLMIYAMLENGSLKNKKVVAPAVSWVTTISPLIHLGFNIALCDCDNNNLGLDLNHLEYICKKHKPSLLILVNVLGHANHVESIFGIANRYNMQVLEDSCEAFGSMYKGKKLGTIGKAGSFSFYYGHHISTIEGGAVVTDDPDLYNIMLSIRSHGWARDLNVDVHKALTDKYNIDEFRDLYTFYYPGFNLRSTDLNAFIGISQLNKIDRIVKSRRDNFYSYKECLKEYWSQQSETDVISSFAYGTLVENRLDVYNHLKKNRIETRPLICGSIGRHPFWINKFGELKLPNADVVHDFGLYLPNHYNLNKEDLLYISEVFKQVALPKYF